LTGLLLITLALAGSYRVTAPALASRLVDALWIVLALQRFLKDKERWSIL